MLDADVGPSVLISTPVDRHTIFDADQEVVAAVLARLIHWREAAEVCRKGDVFVGAEVGCCRRKEEEGGEESTCKEEV